MHNKGNYKKGERKPSEWEKIIENEATDKRINLQNIQAAHAAQYQKNKQPNQKVGRRPKQTFLQRRHTDSQQTHEKMLNVAHYYRNANQNYNEISPHTGQSGNHQEIHKQKMLEKCGGNGKPLALLMKM